MDTRTCKTCEKEKSLSDNFRPHTVKGKVYFEYECRRCTVDKVNKKRAENPEEFRAAERARYAAKPENYRARCRRNRLNSREKTRKRSKERRTENIDKVRAQNRAIAKRWRAAHPFEAKQWSAKQRAIKRSVKTGQVTKKQIDNLHLKQKGKCAICRKKLTTRHIDHIIPLSKGGAHEILNFQITCPGCNMSKKAEHPIDYMQKLGYLL
jgi:5-methylcytosine-specific restriction endonuclease McrA